jgi:serine/threonine protein phosphatase PrpC
MNYQKKYLKYKQKYLELKNKYTTLYGGVDPNEPNESSRKKGKSVNGTSIVPVELKRSISAPIDSTNTILIPSYNILGKRKDTDLLLPRSKSGNSAADNPISEPPNWMAFISDPGYSQSKSITIYREYPKYKKTISYTEDAHAGFSVNVNGIEYDVMIIADGHGGTPEVARQSVALAKLHFGEKVADIGADIPRALNNLIEFINEQISRIAYPSGGCTFNIAVIRRDTRELTVANLGDSRLLVLRRSELNQQYELIFETVDHDASSLREQIRILKINPGATFPDDGPTKRINGLMVVGGFGDHSDDRPVGIVRRLPDINLNNLDPQNLQIFNNTPVKIEPNFQLNPGDLIIQSSDGLYELFNIPFRTFIGNTTVRTEQIVGLVNKFIKVYGNITIGTDINKVPSNIGRLPGALLSDLYYKNKNGLETQKIQMTIEQIKQQLDNQSIHVYMVQ